jgi:cold shock CspA family protein/Cdc6-like AAA superfamily ATPase
MGNVDLAEKSFKLILADIKADILSIESEEDAKVKIINRIFSECLGWSFTQFSCENKHDCGYSDYVLKVGGTPSLIVEAKRIGILDVESAVLDRYRNLKISGTSLKQSMDGIRQAFSYASEAGIPIAVVTDGIRWIIFKTWVQGSSYKEKEAFVFPSLEALENSFSVFYELLAHDSFAQKTYNLLFDSVHNSRKSLSLPLKSPIEAEEITLLEKSPLAFDLEKIFNGFFTHLVGDSNAEIMAECFIESNESRIADYSLEKITNSILSNISTDNSRVGSDLTALIELNVHAELPSESDMSAFIVGPTGSGKTTYVDRFFSKILPINTRKNCLVVSVNCLDATGDEETTIGWITENLVSSLEKGLFEKGFPEYNDFQGMYFGTYQRMSSGYLKKVYENDRNEFDKRFSDFLESEVKSNREGYLESLLNFSIRNRKKLPIIVLDNTDEFTLEFKTKIFQFCNAYRRKVKYCMLIFPVTDKSAWVFSKTDIFTIHQSKSFFLPTPSPREVFRKRIDFLNKKLVVANDVEKRAYLTSKGIKIEFKNINKFAQVLEDVFVENNFTAKTLGELTNYNIRSIMTLSKRIITSPIMRIEDLVVSYLTTEPIRYNKFIDALICGNYQAYKAGTGDDFGIVSTFKVNSDKVHSPLMMLRILSLLKITKFAGRDVEERHLSVQSIVQYFEALGVDLSDFQRCLVEMISLRLVEPYDPSVNVLSDYQKLAITYKGNAHYDLSTKNNVYFYQMAVTTAIADPEVVHKIKTSYKSNRPFGEVTAYVRKQFSEYLVLEDKKFVSSDQDKEQFECQRDLLRDIESFGKDRSASTPEHAVNAYTQQLVCKVLKYDSEKSYGFISTKGLNHDVYFKMSSLESSQVDTVYDFDVIYCTLTQGKGGVVVKSIDGFVEGENTLLSDRCIIKNYNSTRGFGFVQIGFSSNEAFFHKSAFPHNFQEHLKEGLEFEAEIRRKEDGKFQVRRCVGLVE